MYLHFKPKKMKKSFPFLVLIICQFFSSCIFPNGENDINNDFKPLYLTRTQLENSVLIKNPKSSIKAGKIYIKDDLMFVNDVNRGFQVYDYSNPENPIAISYINFPGATDMAIRNNIIYVNQAVDLVSVSYNVSNNSILVTNRIRNSFPQKISPQGFEGNGTENKIIIDWIEN